MRARVAIMFSLVVAFTTASTNAHADEAFRPQQTHHRSLGAYVGGIVLMSVGGTFLAGGSVLGGGAIYIAGLHPITNNGGVAMGVDAVLAAACFVVGLPMFIPGAVMVAKSSPQHTSEPLPSPVHPVELGTHEQPPPPSFFAVPLFSGRF